MAAAERKPEETRQALLDAAFKEMHRNGFQAASLSNIIEQAGVTKGALYHHFSSKKELGYAVVDEIIAPWIARHWLTFEGSDDPIGVLTRSMRGVMKGTFTGCTCEPTEDEDAACTCGCGDTEGFEELLLECGCPLENLAQEMSAIDEGFRTRLNRIFQDWRAGLAEALRRGLEAGTVREGVDPDRVAAFVVATVEGTIGLAKNERSMELACSNVDMLAEYLETLRPAPAAV
jgi:AcrR family transcriptional regulator